MMTALAVPEAGFGIYRQEVARALSVDFDHFYRSEYAAALRFAYLMTGRLPIAEEITQDAFLSAYGRWDRVGAQPDPGAWVRRAIAHASTSWWRRRSTELRVLARLHGEPVVAPELQPQDEVVLDAVRHLPRRQREVIALTLLEDRSIAETAAILGCGEETVRTHLRRGRQALAAALGLPEADE
jgi:RNA polymerase sigma-70 factor (ECF subfamily)